MAAVCSILNPLTQTGPDGLLALFNDDHLNLGLTLRDPSQNDSVAVNAARSPKPQLKEGEQTLGRPVGEPYGLIRNPSQFTAFMYMNLVRVYGITNADSEVSLLSPGLMQFDITTEPAYGSLSGCSDGGNSGWLFYLKSNQVTIMEYNLTTTHSKPVSQTNVLDGTSLGAFWDATAGQRVVVYQSNQNNVIYLSIGGSDEGPTIPMKGSDGSRQLSPIAACCHVSKSIYYIYYLVPEDYQIRRISYNYSTNKFSNIYTLPEPAPPADQFTNIYVTAAAGVNHVFYLFESGQSQTALFHFRDDSLV